MTDHAARSVASSPAASGPAGALFEGQVGAHYLLTMLAGASPRGLPGSLISGIKLQRSVEGHPLDDVIVHASDQDGAERILEIQVKRTATFAPGDTVFRDVVHQLARAVPMLDRSSQRHQFAIAIERTSFKASGPYQDVLRWARELETAAVFMARIDREGVGHKAMRTFVDTVGAHLASGGCPDDDDTVWETLRRFSILAFDFDAPGSQSEELALERARGMLEDGDAPRAGALWRTLTEAAIRHAASAGSIDRQSLLDELSREDGFRIRGGRLNRAALATLAEEARLAAADLKGRVAGVSLARAQRLGAVRAALDTGRYVEIRGGPGVGKSGLLGMLVEETLAAGQAVILTPQRTPPGGWRAFKSQLGISTGPEAFIADLASDGGATIFIDSVDFFDDPDKRVTVTDIVRAAVPVSGIRVVVTARTRFDGEEPSWLPKDALAALGKADPVVMEELSTDEVDELRTTAPSLRGLLSDQHPAREVARNLFRLSRLIELHGDIEQIHSEADLLERWWTTADGPTARRRERKRLIAELANAALEGRGQSETSAEAAVIDELIASATLRELGLDKVAFEHDVLREWAVAAFIHDDPTRLSALRLTAPVPAPLARGIELAARLSLERGADGAAWTSFIAALSDRSAHASWRRWSLLAILRSEKAEELLDRAAEQLLQAGGSLLRELIRTALAVESEPIADLVARLGGDASSIPRALNGPSNGSWARLVRWLLRRHGDLPLDTLSDVTQLFQSLAGAMFFTDPLTPEIAAVLAVWLEEAETAQDHPPFRSDPPRFSRMRFHDLINLVDEMRTAFLLMAMRVPDLAKTYATRQLSRHNPGQAVDGILKFRGTLAQAAPTELVELTLAALIPDPADKDDDHYGTRRDEAFSHVDRSFLPASPNQGPFLDLLNAEPGEGQRLIRTLAKHAIAWRSGGRDPGKDGIALHFPAGPRFFPWIRSYAWSRQMNGGYALESSLMALEAWSHVRVERGDALQDVINDILGPPSSISCFLLVAVDILLSHWPATAQSAIPFLASPELLCLDRERHTHDNMPQFDPFGLGSIGPREPSEAVSAVDLSLRPSRLAALEGALGWFAGNVAGRDELRRLLEQAATRLGPIEPGDTFAMPRFMARHALNLSDPANWQGVGIERRYVSPKQEADHLRALQDGRAEETQDWGINAAIQVALEKPEQSNRDLADRALEYARRRQSAPANLDDDASGRLQTLVAAALIVARDASDELLSNAESWVRAVFDEALSADGDVAGSTFTGGIRFNPPAVATLGLVHLWHRGRGDERARLLAIAGREDPAGARGMEAGLGMVRELDPMLPQAMLRCALVAQIHPDFRWDTSEEEKAKGAARRSDAVGKAAAAELAWLLDRSSRPRWPALPKAPVHVRRRTTIGGRAEVLRRAARRPKEYFRSQTAAVWMRALVGSADGSNEEWLPELVNAYLGWTAQANGAGFGRDADVGSENDDWNSAFLTVMAQAIVSVPRRKAESWLTALAEVPDEPFFDIAENLMLALDLQFFNGGRLTADTLIRFRDMLADRLMQSREWSRERERDDLAVEMRIGPAIAPFFFSQYNAISGIKPYLLAPALNRVAPFLPLMRKMTDDGPVPFTSQLTMSLVEVSPQASLLGFVLDGCRHWLTRQPDNSVLWIDSGLGGRVARWIEVVVTDDPTAATLLREQLDDVLARMVRVGVAEAHRLELSIAAGRHCVPALHQTHVAGS